MSSPGNHLPEIDDAQKRSAFESAPPKQKFAKVRPSSDLEGGDGSGFMESPKKTDR